MPKKSGISKMVDTGTVFAVICMKIILETSDFILGSKMVNFRPKKTILLSGSKTRIGPYLGQKSENQNINGTLPSQTF